MIVKTEELVLLKNNIYNWNSYTEGEVAMLLRDFEKYPREEYSEFYITVFSDNLLAEKIVEIAATYSDNTSILCNIISSLGNMIVRYRLIATDEIFNLFVKSTINKKANYFVSLFILSFPQYQYWNNKWEYLISIPTIAPKNKSILNFHTEVKKLVKNDASIPLPVKNSIIAILSSYIKTKNISDYSKSAYQNTIDQLSILH